MTIKAEGLTILKPVQQITLKNNENTFVKFEADAKGISKKIPYTMSVLDSEKKFGDSLSGVIDVSLAPVFINSVFKNTPLQQ